MEYITLPKLKEYQKFGGDDDIWSRGSNKRFNSSEEWYLISPEKLYSLKKPLKLAKKETEKRLKLFIDGRFKK